MKYTIQISEVAQADLQLIYDYLYRFTFSKSTVEKFHDEVYSTIFSLQLFPNMYPKFDDIYRIITVRKQYRILYEVDEIKKQVIISSIIASKSNISKNFGF
ncbi:type II toxin-antitoxin system RelE/ParE family toxin [Candidatus Gracilibacteria bacterium]|nr:type II toxin-antitoxin system RelE/ParE family toxin [Candidatus Gracilibacteria bacterium]